MFQAKIIAHSICANTHKEMITWELVYPRFIHSELMTHGMLVKNAASSRAIPVQKMIDMVKENPAMPVHWGKNQPGMQASEELTGLDLVLVKDSWIAAARKAVEGAEYMTSRGAHKQVVNRILEPFQWMKTVVSGTEWANFYWLRDHDDAQPEFRYLARMMREVYENSVPNVLFPGEWHLPYFKYNEHTDGFWIKCMEANMTLADAQAISMSCCAQVSYRVLDDTLEKAHGVVERLNLGVDTEKPVHASPSAHQATPMKSGFIHKSLSHSLNLPGFAETWEDGVTAFHRELGLMSGNLAGWIQLRQTIPGHCRW